METQHILTEDERMQHHQTPEVPDFTKQGFSELAMKLLYFRGEYFHLRDEIRKVHRGLERKAAKITRLEARVAELYGRLVYFERRKDRR